MSTCHVKNREVLISSRTDCCDCTACVRQTVVSALQSFIDQLGRINNSAVHSTGRRRRCRFSTCIPLSHVGKSVFDLIDGAGYWTGPFRKHTKQGEMSTILLLYA